MSKNRNISIPFFGMFSCFKRCFIFALFVHSFSVDVVLILSTNSLFVSGLFGFTDVCKIRAKLVYGNDMYVFTNFTIFEQILEIHNTTISRNKPGSNAPPNHRDPG